MRYFVADHRSEAAVIYGIIGRKIEERRLQDAGGQRDIVIGRRIGSIDDLRIKSPSSLVSRLADIGYYRFAPGSVAGVECFVSRTGYTGEDGFELYCRDRNVGVLWSALTTAGAPPIGLGARDSLRLEMGYALYGHEIDRTITPLEAGLGWIVKLDKGSPFVGDRAIRAQKERGLTRKLVGFRLLGRGIPRQGYPVWLDGRQVDQVRSGAMSPSLSVPIGTTFLPVAAAKPETQLQVECRGERLPAEVVSRPFWKAGTAGNKSKQ